MEAKPLKIVPISHNNSGSGPQMKKIEGGEVDEGKKGEGENSSSSNVELDSGVGAHSAINPVITARHQKCCFFSDFQRRELDHQVYIFNHFASDLPLPHYMLQSPSHMSECSGVGFGYGTMVDDPEPHRCRRTDGRKWRCSKNTVPDQKYCERHMHRGCNRSRKPVETSSQVNSSLTTKPCGNMSHAKPAPNTESAVSSPNIVTIHEPPSTQSKSFSIVNTSSLDSRSRNVTGSADYQTPFSPAISPKVTTTFSSMASVTPHNRSHLNVHNKKDEQNSSCISNKISIKSSGKGSIVCHSNGISTGIGFSPRSVLQVSGCNQAHLSIEYEPSRCRRTDGKKWRCKIDVLPGQKYCATHMNRGSKKRVTSHEPAATTTSTTFSVNTAQSPYPSATTNNIQKAQITNLSMSVPAAAAAAALTQSNEKSASSNDTDIIISDTINECNNYLSS